MAARELAGVLEVEALARGRGRSGLGDVELAVGLLLVAVGEERKQLLVALDVGVVCQAVGVGEERLEGGAAAQDGVGAEVGEGVVGAAAEEEVGGTPQVDRSASTGRSRRAGCNAR